jgi:signal transduction histidine kinase
LRRLMPRESPPKRFAILSNRKTAPAFLRCRIFSAEPAAIANRGRGHASAGNIPVLAPRRSAQCLPFLLAFAFAPQSALAAGLPIGSPDIFLIIALVSFALAMAVWALTEHRSSIASRRALRTSAEKARTMISARDAWLSAGRESLLIWSNSGSDPVSYGNGAVFLRDCMAGPDAADLESALKRLTTEGSEFAITCRTADRRMISVRGRPAGGNLLVFLDEQSAVVESLDYRGALNALPIPVWIRDKNLSLRFVNRAFLTLAGLSEEAAYSGNVAFERSERELAAAAQAGSQVAEATRFAVVSGARRALALTLSPLSDGSIAGSAMDVTGQTEAETRLRQHIMAHADIIDRMHTAVAVFGSDRKLTFYNPAFAELWGLQNSWLDTRPSHGELLDRLRELRKLPEQTDFRAWKQLQSQVFENRELEDEVWHLPGGQSLRVTARPQPLGGVALLFEDVSEALRLESSYNTLMKVQKASLDTLQEGVAVFGPDGRLKLHNLAFARIWQFEAGELSGEPHLRQITKSCAARFGGDRIWDAVTASVTTAASARTREWSEMERSDGAIIRLSIAPLPDGATFVSFADITDRFRIETALRERNDALEASDRMKSEFVRRMSYELRTPLNTIMGFSEMLRDGTAGPLNVKQREYSDAVIKASSQLRDLINDVLDLSDLESRSVELEYESVDLYLLLSGIAEHARGWAIKAGLTFRFDCKQQQSPFLGDPRRLKQVVFNLIANAFKYTPKGGTVTLGGRINADEVQFFVADTGPGVPPDIMASVFDRFSARGGAVARAGAGIGLTLVKQFIELHGGWVELESQIGGGTRVTCHVPRKREPRKSVRQSAKLPLP